MSKVSEVPLLSKHGSALLLVSGDKQIRIRAIAEGLGVSERVAQAVMVDLVRGGFLRRSPKGRGYLYEIADEQPLKLPVPGGSDVRSFLDALAGRPIVARGQCFDEIFAHWGIPTATFDPRGTVLRVNQALADLFGEPVSRFPGAKWFDFVHPGDLAQWRELVDDLANGARVDFGEQRFVRADGTIVWTSMNAAAVRVPEGRPAYYLVHLTDVSDRKRLEEQFDYYDYYDSLTGLANKSLLRNRLAIALGQLHRHGDPIELIIIRLEHFKLIYDALGLESGDELIRQVAIRLATHVGPDDVVSRVGDDEFAVLTGLDGTREDDLAQRIMTALRTPFESSIKQRLLSTSLGAVRAHDRSTVDQLLRDASAAADRARESGGSRAVHFDEHLLAEASRRSSLLVGLLQAVDENQLVLHYQPIVNLATGRLEKVEALLRWDHPEFGLVPPGEFIPLVEQLELSSEIGGWVINEACRQLAAWIERGRDISVSVNVSAQQMITTQLVDVVKQALTDHGLDPRRLTLELTESILMVNGEVGRQIADDLSALGVRLSIDDFGTGYSSLARLKSVPVDELKIDQSFVRPIGGGENTSLLEAMIAMARALGLTITAEGIESESQLACLRALGCDNGQGFYLAKPLAATELTGLLGEPLAWRTV